MPPAPRNARPHVHPLVLFVGVVLSVTAALFVAGQLWRLPLPEAASAALFDATATASFTAVAFVVSAVAERWWTSGPSLPRNLAVGAVALVGGGELGVQVTSWGWGLAPVEVRSQILSVGAVVLAIFMLVSLRAERSRLQLEVGRLRLAEAELALLRSRLTPHFLFNSLNTISSLIGSDPEEAEDTVDDVATLLRHVVRATQDSEVALAVELDAVRAYLAIQKRRFEERLSWTLSVPPHAEEQMVPTLVLQPLVENAVLHAVADSATPVHIAIDVRHSAQALHLAVRDDGPGASTHQGQGTTLAGLSRRLALRVPPGRLTAGPTSPRGFSVELELPHG